MPSWEIHQKYGEKMGIRKAVMGKIDKLIDNPQHHDAYDKCIRRIKCKRESTGIITYTFYFPMFTSFFLKGMTDEEIKYFFLHVFLDLIERRLRRRSSSRIRVLNIWLEGDTSV